jgi:hypothetical protein
LPLSCFAIAWRPPQILYLLFVRLAKSRLRE